MNDPPLLSQPKELSLDALKRRNYEDIMHNWQAGECYLCHQRFTSIVQKEIIELPCNEQHAFH